MNIIEAVKKMIYGATIQRKSKKECVQLKALSGECEYTKLEFTGNDILADDWEIVENISTCSCRKEMETLHE